MLYDLNTSLIIHKHQGGTMEKFKNFFKATISQTTFIKSLVSIVLILMIFYLLELTGVRWGSWITLIMRAIEPFLFAYILAFVLSPLVHFVDKKIKRRGISIFLVVILTMVLVTVIVLIAVPNIFLELYDFLDMGINGATGIVNSLRQNRFYGLQDILNEMDINILDYFNISNLTQYATEIITGSSKFVINFISDFISLILQALVVFILTIYFLTNEDKIKKLVKKGSAQIHPDLPTYLYNASVEVQKYVKMFALIMLSKLPQYMLLFYLVGHRSWFLLGVLNMVAVLVPYVGPVIVNVLALVTALSQGPFTIFGTIFIIGWSSFGDQYLIMPKIYNSQVNINALLLLFGMYANATLFGLIGVIIAIPQILIIRSIYQTRKTIKERDLKNQTIEEA